MSENLKLQRVLVTGGRGFIGRHLVNYLLSRGMEVVSADIVPTQKINSHAVEIEVDIRQLDAMTELLSSNRFDAVFDLASFTEAGLPSSAYERNIVATDTMTRVIEKVGVRRYVFFSTQFVFRKPGVCPAGPDDYAPSEAYGESKIISEELIKARLSPERRLIMRPTYIWGPGLERFRLGLLSRLEKGQMLVSNDPNSKRYYGYVETVAEQAFRLLDSWDRSSQSQVFYLSDDAISLREFCEHLVVALGTGRCWSVSPSMIRLLGEFGPLFRWARIKPPIDRIQARELTGSFPVPLERTLELTGSRTDYSVAAEKTVRWARSMGGRS